MSVPKYRLDAIETIGRKILQEYDPVLLDGPPQAVPIETIIETKFDLTLEYHCLRKNGSILGETIFDEGAAILYDQDEKRYRLIAVKAGTILVEERLCVDRLLGRLRFTCAHELGHWVLHQKLYSGTGDVAAYEGKTSLDESHGLVEWQADALAKHICCGGCGSLCRKKITGGKTYWVCRRHDGNKADCPTPQIPEPEITAAVLRLYHKLKLGQETVLRPVLSQLQELRERELRSNRKISDIDNEIARISEQNLVLVRLKSKGYVDSALYLSQMDEIDRKLRELRKLRRRLLEAAGEDRQIHDTERMMEYLEDGPEWLDEVPAELFGELIERIIIISPERLKFRLLNGMELAENIERTVR